MFENDPAMLELMRRQFQRRRPGEVRGNFPMPQEVPPGMAPAPVAPPPSALMPPRLAQDQMMPAPPPGPMPMPPSAAGGMTFGGEANPLAPPPGGFAGEANPLAAPDLPLPPMMPQPPRAAMRAPMQRGAGGADELNSLVLALMEGRAVNDTRAERIRALMGYSNAAPLGPGMG